MSGAVPLPAAPGETAPLAAALAPPPLARVTLHPADLERDLARLVLTLIEFLRRLMEAQAARRMAAGTISADQAEELGLTLMGAQEAVLSLCARLGIAPGTLNLDLGPLGRLL
jgi:hypothetical protein